jgi:DNA-directed RNA polymerase subunit beta'
LTDTALRTSSAGYLTRRLVDVAQDVVINNEDCGDSEGIAITKKESDIMGESMVSRVWGRYLTKNIIDPKTDKKIMKAGELVTEKELDAIGALNLDEIHVRSILACKNIRGVCKKCYGYDLA